MVLEKTALLITIVGEKTLIGYVLDLSHRAIPVQQQFSVNLSLLQLLLSLLGSPVVKKEELNCPANGVGEAPGKGHKPVPDDLQGGEALLLPNRHNPLHLEAGWLHSLQCF